MFTSDAQRSDKITSVARNCGRWREADIFSFVTEYCYVRIVV